MTREEAYQFLKEIFLLLKTSKYPYRYKFHYGETESFWVDLRKQGFIAFEHFNLYLNSGDAEFSFTCYKVGPPKLFNRSNPIEKSEATLYFALEDFKLPSEYVSLTIDAGEINGEIRINEVNLYLPNSFHLKSVKYLIYNILYVNKELNLKN